MLINLGFTTVAILSQRRILLLCSDLLMYSLLNIRDQEQSSLEYSCPFIEFKNVAYGIDSIYREHPPQIVSGCIREIGIVLRRINFVAPLHYKYLAICEVFDRHPSFRYTSHELGGSFWCLSVCVPNRTFLANHRFDYGFLLRNSSIRIVLESFFFPLFWGPVI